MNSVLIIGNGFDLEMGLKTKYTNFYNSEYCPKTYPAPLIFHLNEKWDDNLDEVKWYDLENELLNYFLSIKNNGGPYDIVDQKELEYLKKIVPYQIAFGIHMEEYGEQINSLIQKGIIVKASLGYTIPYHQDLFLSSSERDQRALEMIKNGLCKYLKSITESNPEPGRYCVAFQVFRSLLDNLTEKDTLHIYSFNYTPIPWGFNRQYDSIIHYVHGSCDTGRIIIGTRDEDFNKEYCFLQKSFDKHFSPPPIVEDLENADEVIIFGHSLGLNDRQYFKHLFTSQAGFGASKSKTITIFTKNVSSVVEIKRSLQQLTDKQLSVLMSRNRVSFIETDFPQENDRLLYEFLISHGNDKHQASEIIGKIAEWKKKEATN